MNEELIQELTKKMEEIKKENENLKKKYKNYLKIIIIKIKK